MTTQKDMTRLDETKLRARGHGQMTKTRHDKDRTCNICMRYRKGRKGEEGVGARGVGDIERVRSDLNEWKRRRESDARRKEREMEYKRVFFFLQKIRPSCHILSDLNTPIHPRGKLIMT
jgi:hypothetical protein